jgi:hypothetical protein
MPGSGAQPGGTEAGGANPAGGNTGNTGNTGSSTSSSSSSSSSSDEPKQLAGLGIKININTATRPVLRCLLSPSQMPDAVIEAILRYRNEEAPEEEQLEEAGGEALSGSGASSLLSNPDGVQTGDRPQLQVFATPEDLEKVPEFANIASAEIKQQFLDLITTKSDVFSIHMASLVKRDEENRVFVLRRARSLVMRFESGETVMLHPLIRLEAREGVRVFPYDFPKEELEAQRMRRHDMDEFAIEERDWNPFYLEFYRKPEARGR